MNKTHKWAKEIISYLNGEKVYGKMDTHKSIIAEFEVSKLNQFDLDNHLFYTKPQPKEPKYLYVYFNKQHHDVEFVTQKYKPTPPTFLNYVGKIKLENEDES